MVTMRACFQQLTAMCLAGFIAPCTVIVSGCDDTSATEVAGLAGRDGMQRFVVTMGSAPDLERWRSLQRDAPQEVPAFIDARRSELAKAQSSLDQVVAGLGGRVVSRWWMTGQATIEIKPEAVAIIRGVAGVSAVEPDRPLQ